MSKPCNAIPQRQLLPLHQFSAPLCSSTTLPGVCKLDLHTTVKIWAHQSCTVQQNTEQIFCLVLNTLPDDAQHFNSFYGWCCYTLS